MAVRPPTIPAPPRTDWLRALAGIALVAVTLAAIAVGSLAIRAHQRLDDVDRVVANAERASARVERDADQLRPTLRELRVCLARTARSAPAAGSVSRRSRGLAARLARPQGD